MATPQSRAEAIVQATIDGETYDGLPQSRLEALLIELNHSGGGGGGGTSDFNQLTNIPTIDGTPIQGEISDDILELVEPFTDEQEQQLVNIITDDEDGDIGQGGSEDVDDED